jgi:hypothetical protein
MAKKVARCFQDRELNEGTNPEHWKEWEERKVDVMRRAIELKFE